MSLMTIEGKVKYIDIEMGFWGIISESGKKYLPINMPSQLKQEGASVSITARTKDSVGSIQMWGTPIEVISFRTRFRSC
jgi:hypothetical protein